jgi:hypothetical protein
MVIAASTRAVPDISPYVVNFFVGLVKDAGVFGYYFTLLMFGQRNPVVVHQGISQ